MKPIFSKSKIAALFDSMFVLLLMNCTVQQKQQPNILFFITDDQSFPHSSAYGESWIQTPGFDRVAKEGILFNNAFVASPGCAPSRAAIITGKYPWQIGHAGNHHSFFPAELQTFPAILQKNGYHVGYTGKGSEPSWWIMSGRDESPAGAEYNKYNGNYFENFKQFISGKTPTQPFFFWLGTNQPHRKWELGAGLKKGKNAREVTVPGFIPDNEITRGDLLDYAVQVENADNHLEKTLNYLDSLGLLENTLIIVTSDNGIAMPHAKATCFEYGIHVPLAMYWKNKIKPHQKTDNLISLVDMMPTILESAGIKFNADSLAGKSIWPTIIDGEIQPSQTEFVLSGRERHSNSRWLNLGYPQRALRTNKYLYIRNYHPERWPSGAPQAVMPGGSLGPLYGQGIFFRGIPNHGAFFDIDGGPTKAYLIDHRDEEQIKPFFQIAFGKYPAELLYDIQTDPYCMNNLADSVDYQQTKNELAEKLTEALKKTSDAREIGSNPNLFESYMRLQPGNREFPKPDWATNLSEQEIESLKKLTEPDASPLVNDAQLFQNALIKGKWKLVEYEPNKFKLFNLETDPDEKNNIFGEYKELQTNLIGFYNYLKEKN
jgi:N-sulfoglucosamine sulfohydrolase